MSNILKTSLNGSLSASVVIAALFSGMVAPTAFAQTVQTETSTGVEEIVVTAQKREQNLQDVPVAITALTANALAANRIVDVRDLSSVVPNMTVRPSAGGSQVPQYTLRGIYTAGSAVGTDKGVALYIDGVYIQSVAGSFFEAADLERIEVLKGPQGTLFGRNATGGAISYITRNPTGEFGIKQEFTYGNYDQFRSKTRLDLPQFGPLSLSATYLHKERRGDTRNLGAGTQWNYGPATGGALGVRTSPRYLGDENSESVGVAAKLELHSDLDVVYKFDFSSMDYTPEAIGVSYFPTGASLPADASRTLSNVFQALYAAQSPALRTPITSKRPDAVNNAFTTPGTSRHMGHNLTTRWRVNDQITLSNILAFRNTRTQVTFQLDGLGGLTNNSIAALGGAPASFVGNGCLQPPLAGTPTCTSQIAPSLGQPFAFLTNNAFNKQSQWSDELQLNIQTDWLNLTAGYLHFQGKQSTGGIANIRNTSTLQAYYGQGTTAQGTPFVIPANPGFQPSSVKVTSDAFFMQPEFHLTDQIDVVLGARVTTDKKVGSEFYPIQPRVPATSPISYKDTQLSYLAGINYRPVDGVLLYAKYSTGYISGGQLATIQFQPETASSWEAGIKADLFDRRLRTNLAVFDVNYGKIQLATSGTLAGVPAAFPFGIAVISSADAHAYGFEWENTFVPVNGLTLTANLGYLNFKFDQSSVFGGINRTTGQNCFGPQCVALVGGNTAATGGFVAASGAPGYLEFGRPKWTGSFSAQYETGEVLMGGHLTFRTDANFQSRSLLASDVTPGTTSVVGGAVVVAQEDPALRQAATKPFSWIVNARVALTNFDLAGSKATLALWGRNLFDNDDINQFVGLGPIGAVLYERARTYGVDLSVEF